MLTQERHELILNELKEKGSVTVSSLVSITGASEATLRRDLTALDDMGLLVKVHGGAVLCKNYSTIDDQVEERKERNHSEKAAIAKYARDMIKDGDFVYIDAGTTTDLIIQDGISRKATYVTNDIAHAKRLANLGCTVYIIGGQFKEVTEAIVGEEAVTSLKKYHFTKGFFGANGVTESEGFTTPEVKEALVKKAAMENCKECIVLADSSKFLQISSVTFADFDDAMILTSKSAPVEYRKKSNVVEVN